MIVPCNLLCTSSKTHPSIIAHQPIAVSNMRSIIFIPAICVDGGRLTTARHTTSTTFANMPAFQRFITARIVPILNSLRVLWWCILGVDSGVRLCGQGFGFGVGSWVPGDFGAGSDFDEFGISIPFSSTGIAAPTILAPAAIVPLCAK